MSGLSRFSRKLPSEYEQILYDPQTSGGLLAALPADQGESLINALKAVPTPAARIIGRVQALKDHTSFLIFE